MEDQKQIGKKQPDPLGEKHHPPGRSLCLWLYCRGIGQSSTTSMYSQDPRMSSYFRNISRGHMNCSSCRPICLSSQAQANLMPD
jgi:hypothetical protein